MIIRIQGQGAPVLMEVYNFKAFHILLDAAHRGAAPVAALAEIGLADSDGCHVWVEEGWLRGHVPAAEAWRAGFEKILAYAAARGWVDVMGRIRAHIEYVASGQPPSA